MILKTCSTCAHYGKRYRNAVLTPLTVHYCFHPGTAMHQHLAERKARATGEAYEISPSWTTVLGFEACQVEYVECAGWSAVDGWELP